MNSFRSFIGSTTGLVVCLLLAALVVYLLWIYTGHVMSALPYLILLACPLMHFFGHGHGHKHHENKASD